jgi:hypothetical protein
MVKKDVKDVARAALFKRLRSAIRTEYAILADERLNELLPAADKVFEDHWQRGTELSIDEVRALLAENPA